MGNSQSRDDARYGFRHGPAASFRDLFDFALLNQRRLSRRLPVPTRHFVTEDIEGQLKRTLVSGFSDALAESKIAALDLASNYDELSKFTREKLSEEFKSTDWN